MCLIVFAIFYKLYKNLMVRSLVSELLDFSMTEGTKKIF